MDLNINRNVIKRINYLFPLNKSEWTTIETGIITKWATLIHSIRAAAM